MTEIKKISKIFYSWFSLWMIITPILIYSQDAPEEFQYNQSTLQAFYFFSDVTLGDSSISSNDWVAAFNGDICVGARQWDTSQCGAGICDIPVMGNDGAEFTSGYMQFGDTPTFKIYNLSTNTIYQANPAQPVDSWSVNGFSINDLLVGELSIEGCMDQTACNYDSQATENCTNCCEYIQNGECDCDGSIDLGCGCGQIGPSGCDNNCGSNLINDSCGICDGDNSSCTGCMDSLACNFDEENIIENNILCEYSQENYNCAGECEIHTDCQGICGGNAILDDCGICDGDNSICTGCMDSLACNFDENNILEDNTLCLYSEENYNCEGECEVTTDCQGICGGTAILDDCGICEGNSFCSDGMIQGQCIGNFEVGNLNNSGFDCEGWCFGTFSHNNNSGDASCLDCAGVPNGSGIIDACGICNGQNMSMDCLGICPEENGYGSVLDDCGICQGDNSSCTLGCTDENANNYYCDIYDCIDEQPPESLENDNSCLYNISGEIKYFNSNASPIKDVKVMIYGMSEGLSYIVGVDSSDNEGIFLISGVPILNTDLSDNYFLYDSFYLVYDYSENNTLGLSLSDAELIHRYIVGIDDFPYQNYSPIASDVNLDGKINSFDSSLIERYLNNTIFNMNQNNISFRFEANIDGILKEEISKFSESNSILVRGIKLGDPDGQNWNR